MNPVRATDAFAPRPRQSSRRKSANRRKVSRLPAQLANQSLPAWLKLLLTVQRISIVSTVLMTTAVFGTYSYTVYAQKLWNEQFHKLEDLKRDERQLTAAEALVNDNIVSNVENSPGQLTREKPTQTLFIRGESPRPGLGVNDAELEQVEPETAQPLGY
ncbi:hypothetical protein Pse7367_0354 [Thalassoporum mexicanum PCC 7367]|uniref:hypothetical protein n=1 Tax=Thalassoporum mexicanum TaxID=3457544 RepID=UPI00029FA8A1|nr:hypothetical protein [Pseudanabaena sp. PCC 7367]AFY68665.1 hypothetical protein Pse7367_0354 [Pseudanabaena sp. PCC 7367]